MGPIALHIVRSRNFPTFQAIYGQALFLNLRSSMVFVSGFSGLGDHAQANLA